MPSGYICEHCGEIVYSGQKHRCRRSNRGAVLIFGKAGVGKSTLAKYLFGNFCDYTISSAIIPLAAKVKDIACSSFGWDGKKDERGRRLLQVIGTEAGRNYDEDLWVDIVIDRFLKTPFDVVIVDDVRFPNEIARMRETFSYVLVIKVVGPQRSELDEEAQQHASETSLDDYEDYDMVIYNTGNVDNLYAIAQGIVGEVMDEWK